MSSRMQICPNCGAGIVGETAFCPRCDSPLSVAPSARESDDREGAQPVAPYLVEEDTRQQAPIDDHLFENEFAPTQKHMRPPDNALTAPVPEVLIGVTAPETDRLPRLVSAIAVPPAPYTPPPLDPSLTMSVEPYSYPSNYYLLDRVNEYRQGGYELHEYSTYQASLAYGKPLGFWWWLLALFSGIGFAWYLLILLVSGFSKDRLFIVLERDGTLYEDGGGAAHTRARRARSGERWGMVGMIFFIISLVIFAILVGVAVLTVDQYQPEIQAAYPAVSGFLGLEYQDSIVNVDEVEQIRRTVLFYAIVAMLASIGVLGGLAMTIVGYLHSAAYRVNVRPLPEVY